MQLLQQRLPTLGQFCATQALQLAASFLGKQGLIPVSYTHLDVYKRQLLAAGRSPNTKDLFGPGFSVEQDEKGAILVDEHFRTNRENVYAIGDVIPGVQLAHVASAQGIVAVEDMLGKEPSIRLDVIPDCIYTNPEIASVGLTEACLLYTSRCV